MSKRSLSAMFDRLAAAESQFLGQEFLAPMIAGGEIRVRIADVVCQMKVEPADFRGWGVFQPMSWDFAKHLRLATLSERQNYLRLFPGVLLVLCERRANRGRDSYWLGVAAHRGDTRFRIEGCVPIRMVEEAEPFDVVRARFDGATFWFDSLDPGHNSSQSAYLRESLRAMVPPEELKRSGLTPEERAAYSLCFKTRHDARVRTQPDQTETRLRSALKHAGAEFVDYLERKDGYRVTYRIGDRQMVSSVEKDDLTVQVAGICLSGEDQKFDLASLVGVLREGGEHTVAIGAENHGMDEDRYWSIYRR